MEQTDIKILRVVLPFEVVSKAILAIDSYLFVLIVALYAVSSVYDDPYPYHSANHHSAQNVETLDHL